MKLYPDKLAAHLQKKTLPIYLLYGDEPLQLQRMGDLLREHARAQGCDEREVLFMLDDSDWPLLHESTASMSLFAQKRLIELRMPSGKPGRVGGERLKAYAQNPAPDVILIIHSGKLDRSGTSAAWFKAIDKVGAVITARAPIGRDLTRWLQQELERQQLGATPEALALLRERIEGNLLAGAQEVERLALLCPGQVIGVDEVLSSVSDSARFAVGDLSNATLLGQAPRALRVLHGLREEAVAETLVLWSLTQDVRAGTRVAESMRAGVAEGRAMQAAGVWSSRVGALQAALGRHPDANHWLEMLAECSRLDRMIKGRERGSPWDAMADLALRLAGNGTPVMARSLSD